MRIEQISAREALNESAFKGADFREDLNTRDARDEMDNDKDISTKMDETMKYLNALSNERKCDIQVDMDYDPKTGKGEITGEITDKTGKRPKRHVRVMIDSNNKLNITHHINQFRSDCSSLM